jgi:inorganic triphosphatase YgiF
MAVNVNETEIKYDAPPGAALPRLGDLPQVARISGPDEEQLEAEYYDTDDLRLIHAGITVRRRRGGDDAGWHLKLPLGAATRREIQLPPGRTGRQVPGELAELIRVHTRGEPLRPVARITTKRQRLTLLDQAGESLAEVMADDVSAQTLGDTTTVSGWHEVEVELTGGSRQLLKAAGKLLRRDGLRPAGRPAKLERALEGQLPEPARQVPLTSSSPAGQVVLAYLQTHAEALKSLDPMVRRDEPDAVHQMRVATRRVRSTLRSPARSPPGCACPARSAGAAGCSHRSRRRPRPGRPPWSRSARPAAARTPRSSATTRSPRCPALTRAGPSAGRSTAADRPAGTGPRCTRRPDRCA